MRVCCGFVSYKIQSRSDQPRELVVLTAIKCNLNMIRSYSRVAALSRSLPFFSSRETIGWESALCTGLCYSIWLNTSTFAAKYHRVCGPRFPWCWNTRSFHARHDLPVADQVNLRCSCLAVSWKYAKIFNLSEYFGGRSLCRPVPLDHSCLHRQRSPSWYSKRLHGTRRCRCYHSIINHDA